MITNKWNPTKKEYEPCEIPNDWNITTYEDDMDAIINCVHCGKKISFGESYTSRRYHTCGGFGYCECEDCYFNYKE